MKKTLLFIIAIVVLIALWAMSAYNGMIGVQENATQAAADVQSAYQRRADLIPNLVETVKGYAQHEENTLKEVTEARNKYNAAVTEYNKNIRSFPNNIFAGIFGFKTMEKFAAESGAEKAPKVQF